VNKQLLRLMIPENNIQHSMTVLTILEIVLITVKNTDPLMRNEL
jgi:hypothetical protein